jgi:hypothetical protein
LSKGLVESDVGLLSFRNKLINGNFDFWQRGTSQTATGYGSVDRWESVHHLTSKTMSQMAFTPGQTEVPGNPKYYLRTVISSANTTNNFVLLVQRIENVDTCSGKTVTVSFWGKANANMNIVTEYEQSFGTGGDPLNHTIGVKKHNLTTSWQKFTTTKDIPSVYGRNITRIKDSFQLVFWYDAGTNYNDRLDNLGPQSGTIDIAQVQVEEGEVATPFEDRPSGLELNLCQRYYEKTTVACLNHATAGNMFMGMSHNFATQKRDAPTIHLLAPGVSNNLNPIGEASSNAFGFRIYVTSVNAGLMEYYDRVYGADAEL